MNLISRSPVCHNQTKRVFKQFNILMKISTTLFLQLWPPNRGLSTQYTDSTLLVFILKLYNFILQPFIFIFKSFTLILHSFIFTLQSFIIILQLFLFVCKYFSLFSTFFLEPRPPNRGLSAQHTAATLYTLNLQLFVFILQSFIFILQLFISTLQLFILTLEYSQVNNCNLFSTFFLDPRPPNRGLSAQAGHWPQSSRIQPSHSPHRRVLVALLELP